MKMQTAKQPRGGARAGSGRKVIPAEHKKKVFCRYVTQAEFKILDEKISQLRLKK